MPWAQAICRIVVVVLFALVSGGFLFVLAQYFH